MTATSLEGSSTSGNDRQDGADLSAAPVVTAFLPDKGPRPEMHEGTGGQESLAGPLELTLTRDGGFIDKKTLVKILRDPNQQIVDREPRGRPMLFIDEHNQPHWRLHTSHTGRLRRLPDILYKVRNDSLSSAGTAVEMYGSDKHATGYSSTFHKDRQVAPSIVLQNPVLRAKNGWGKIKVMHTGDVIRITGDEILPGSIHNSFSRNSDESSTRGLAPIRLRTGQEAFCVSIDTANKTVDLLVKDPFSSVLAHKNDLRLNVVSGGKSGFSKFDHIPAASEDRINVTLSWGSQRDRSSIIDAELKDQQVTRTLSDSQPAPDNRPISVKSDRTNGSISAKKYELGEAKSASNTPAPLDVKRGSDLPDTAVAEGRSDQISRVASQLGEPSRTVDGSTGLVTTVRDALDVVATMSAAHSGRPGSVTTEPKLSSLASKSHADDIRTKVAPLVRPTLERAWKMSTTFTWGQLSASAAAVLKKANYSLSYRDFLLTAVKEGPDLLQIKPGQPNSKYVDRQLLLAERDIIGGAMDLSNRKSFELPAGLVADVARREGFTHDLTAALQHISGPERATVLNGVAGSGKSMVIGGLAKVVDMYNTGVADSERLRLIAFAPTHKAAEELRKKGIETVDTLYQAYKVSLKSNTIVVIDEMSMAKTIELAPIVRNVVQSTFDEAKRPKIVFVGHELQLPSVGPGDLFPEFVKKVGSFNLTKPLRQESKEWADEAQRLAEDLPANAPKAIGRFLMALHEITDEKVEEGLTEAQRGHGIEFINNLRRDDRNEGRKRDIRLIMKSVDAFYAAHPFGSRLTMAHSNDTVKAGNEHFHSRYVESEERSGQLQKFKIRATIPRTKNRQPDPVDAESPRNGLRHDDSIEIIAGDRILFNDNCLEKGIRNGVFATVNKIQAVHDRWGHPDVEITAHLDDSTELVTWRSSQFKGLTYGYMATINKSQAAGIDNTVVICDGLLDPKLFYVGVTRNKKALRMVVLNSFANGRASLVAKVGRFRPPNNALEFHSLLDNENSRWVRTSEGQAIAHEQPTLKRARSNDDELVPAIATTDRGADSTVDWSKSSKRRKLGQDPEDVVMTDGPRQASILRALVGGRASPPEQSASAGHVADASEIIFSDWDDEQTAAVENVMRQVEASTTAPRTGEVTASEPAAPVATGHVADASEITLSDWDDEQTAAVENVMRQVEASTTAPRTGEVTASERAAPAATGHVADAEEYYFSDWNVEQTEAIEKAVRRVEASTTADDLNRGAQSKQPPSLQTNRVLVSDDEGYSADTDEQVSAASRARDRGSKLSPAEATSARSDDENKRKRGEPEVDRSEVEVPAGRLTEEVGRLRKRGRCGANPSPVPKDSVVRGAPVPALDSADHTMFRETALQRVLQPAANQASMGGEPRSNAWPTRRLSRASNATTSSCTLAHSPRETTASAGKDRVPRASSR